MTAYAYQCFTCGHFMSDHRGGPDSYTCLHCSCAVTDDDHPTLPLTRAQTIELRKATLAFLGRPR